MIFLLGQLALSAQQSVQELFQAAIGSFQNGNDEQFLDQMNELNELLPNHPTVLLYLARAQAINQKLPEASATLESLLRQNAEIPFDTDSTLAPIRQTAYFSHLQKLRDQLDDTVVVSQEHFSVGTEFVDHAEGIAYSQKLQSFYISDVRKRRVLVVGKDFKPAVLLEGNDLLGNMGMDVDEQRDMLWICSSPAPEMSNFDEEMSGKAYLIGFDLKSNAIKVKQAIEAPGIWFGDLTVAENGDVYVSSSSAEYPAIYKRSQVSGKFEEFIHLSDMISLQGITFGDQEDHLYLADYRHGILRLDLSAKTYETIENKTEHSLKGIDGLYFNEGKLVAIHNGLRPFRVVKYDLQRDGKAITGYKYLDKAIPGMNEPTLGTVIKNQLYYISNSPWSLYDENKNFLKEKQQGLIIRRLPLMD